MSELKITYNCARCGKNPVSTIRDICEYCKNALMGVATIDKNFLGTYLTENGSTAVVVTRSAMVIDGKKQVIWIGFICSKKVPAPQFMVWNFDGKAMYDVQWDLKEAVKEKAY